MLIIDKILLPVDFDFPNASGLMARQAAVLARHFHSSIVMLHVIVPPSSLAYALSGGYVPAHILEQARSSAERSEQATQPNTRTNSLSTEFS